MPRIPEGEIRSRIDTGGGAPESITAVRRRGELITEFGANVGTFAAGVAQFQKAQKRERDRIDAARMSGQLEELSQKVRNDALEDPNNEDLVNTFKKNYDLESQEILGQKGVSPEARRAAQVSAIDVSNRSTAKLFPEQRLRNVKINLERLEDTVNGLAAGVGNDPNKLFSNRLEAFELIDKSENVNRAIKDDLKERFKTDTANKSIEFFTAKGNFDGARKQLSMLAKRGEFKPKEISAKRRQIFQDEIQHTNLVISRERRVEAIEKKRLKKEQETNDQTMNILLNTAATPEIEQFLIRQTDVLADKGLMTGKGFKRAEKEITFRRQKRDFGHGVDLQIDLSNPDAKLDQIRKKYIKLNHQGLLSSKKLESILKSINQERKRRLSGTTDPFLRSDITKLEQAEFPRTREGFFRKKTDRPLFVKYLNKRRELVDKNPDGDPWILAQQAVNDVKRVRSGVSVEGKLRPIRTMKELNTRIRILNKAWRKGELDNKEYIKQIKRMKLEFDDTRMDAAQKLIETLPGVIPNVAK